MENVEEEYDKKNVHYEKRMRFGTSGRLARVHKKRPPTAESAADSLIKTM